MIVEFLELTFSRHDTCNLLCDTSLAHAPSSPTWRYTGSKTLYLSCPTLLSFWMLHDPIGEEDNSPDVGRKNIKKAIKNNFNRIRHVLALLNERSFGMFLTESFNCFLHTQVSASLLQVNTSVLICCLLHTYDRSRIPHPRLSFKNNIYPVKSSVCFSSV